MSEEMINLESYDTLGIKMDDPTETRIRELPHPPFFMNPSKALPFWLVRPLADKIPMTNIPLKIKAPYTRGPVCETLVHSVNPDRFLIDDSTPNVEYEPLHDAHLKNFFDKPEIRRILEKNGEVVDGRTVCSLRDYNKYRAAIHKMLLNFVNDEQRDKESLKVLQNRVDRFLLSAKKDGKERWNWKFKEYLKKKFEAVREVAIQAKLSKCRKRLERVERCHLRAKRMVATEKEMRTVKWAAYKKRMDTYFKTIENEQRKKRLNATMRWRSEALINQHRKSLVSAENKIKRESTMEINWARRRGGQELKLKKDKLVRDQYRACIELMRHRREQYYDRKDVEVDELLSLPGMNSLDELEIFNTQVDQFSPEFMTALNGAKFFINRSGRSLTLDKSLRKYIVHRESAAERMKKAYVAGPIKHALDLLIRRSVGYYAMVVTYKTVMENRNLALNLASKIKNSPELRELLLEEYRRFGPRSDVPFQTVKKFDEDGLDHCMCDYALVNKDDLNWPCPLCRKNDSSSTSSSSSTESLTERSPEKEDTFVVAEGETAVEFLVPLKTTEGIPEAIISENAVEFQPLLLESPKPQAVDKEIHAEVKVEEVPKDMKKGSILSKKSRKSIRSMSSRKGSRGSKKSTGSKSGQDGPPGKAADGTDAARKSAGVRTKRESRKTKSKGELSLGRKKSSKKKKRGTRASSKHRKSILKESKGKGKSKTPTKKVSFARLAEEKNDIPKTEQAALVKAAPEETTDNADPQLEIVRSHSSVVSLLSITSDDRLHFVKGQCLYKDGRGSKFGKVGVSLGPGKSPKRGFVRGKCNCNESKVTLSVDSGASNITERICDDKTPAKRRTPRLRWKGKPDQLKDTTSSKSSTCRRVDFKTIVDNWPQGKKMKLKHLLKAHDLKIVCKCPQCCDTPTQDTLDETDLQTDDCRKQCRCRQRRGIKLSPHQKDKLAYIVKAVGKVHQWRESVLRDKNSVGKLSIRTMIEQHKSIISRLCGKMSFKKDILPAAMKREPVVQKYYVDDLGDLYVLNRRGQKTVLCNVGEDFQIDGDGKKRFVDESGVKYLIDVTDRLYMENDDGDLLSLYYEDGKQYVDPEPKKLLVHNLVRESVVNLLHDEGVPEEMLENEEFVELVYEYVFEGLSGQENAEMHSVDSDGISESSESEQSAPTSKKLIASSMKIPEGSSLGPRMPIKRPLNSLIKEVPFNKDISRLFIQRKKFQDSCSIAFRRCLLYSLAKYTHIVQNGFDPLDELEERKKVKGLDGVVKGLTKITAHYPLKLVKSKRLAPHVDALVHSFLGTEGYYVFTRPGKNDGVKGNQKPATAASTLRDRKSDPFVNVPIERIENLEDIKTICYCQKPPANRRPASKQKLKAMGS